MWSSLEADATGQKSPARRTVQGNYRNVAALDAGISDPTFHRWMTAERAEFREFRAVVERAEAEAEIAVVGNLVEISKRDYRAGIAWLEQRAPERWRLDEPRDDSREAFPPAATSNPDARVRWLRPPSDRDDDLASRLAGLDVPDGLRGLAQGIGPVDDRGDLPGCRELAEHEQVGPCHACQERQHPLASQA